jgi:hypothetical protein
MDDYYPLHCLLENKTCHGYMEPHAYLILGRRGPIWLEQIRTAGINVMLSGEGGDPAIASSSPNDYWELN